MNLTNTPTEHGHGVPEVIRMMKKIIFYASFCALAACEDPSRLIIPGADAGGTPTPTPASTPIPVSSPTPSPTPSPDYTGGLKVVIREANNFDTDSRALLEQARALAEKVLNSEEFKQRVLHFTYEGEEAFVQNDGYTNLEIYNQMMAGAELYPSRTSANKTMDLFTELYYGGSGVIGYTNPDTATIYMNSYYYDDYTPAEVVGNITHEWLHKLGYDHDYNSTYRRPYSVPYAIGYIAEDLAEKY